MFLLRLLIAIVLGLIGIVIWVSSNDSHKKRVEQVQRVEIPRWEKAMARWNKLYYCSRDDCVFIPEEDTSAPIAQMMNYIYPSKNPNPSKYPQSTPHPQQRKCPDCGTLVPSHLQHCPKCSAFIK
jgi:hypothetical protein